MPSLLSRCGGGSLNVFYLIAAYNAATVVSGTPKNLVLGSVQTNDVNDTAFHTLGSPTPNVQLVSQEYVYTLTVVVNWTTFSGDRTWSVSLDPTEWAFGVPQQLTTPDDVQTLTSLVYCENAVPTTVTLTAAQSSGSDQTVNFANAIFQAVQLNPAP